MYSAFASTANAQTEYLGGILPLGLKDTATHNITLKQFIANKNKVLAFKENGSSIVSFSIAFLPKNGEYFGPFKIGNNQLNEHILSGVEKIWTAHPQSMNIFFEDVIVKKGNQSFKGKPMIILCKE